MAIQKFFGNVTIYAKPRLRDYFTLLTDPSYSDVEHYLDSGMRSTWPKLCIISHRVTFDDLLEKHYRRLVTALRSRNTRASLHAAGGSASSNSNSNGLHHHQQPPILRASSVPAAATSSSMNSNGGPSSLSSPSAEAAAVNIRHQKCHRHLEHRVSSGMLPSDLQYGSPAAVSVMEKAAADNVDDEDMLSSPVTSRSMDDSVRRQLMLTYCSCLEPLREGGRWGVNTRACGRARPKVDYCCPLFWTHF